MTAELESGFQNAGILESRTGFQNAGIMFVAQYLGQLHMHTEVHALQS